MFDVRHLHWRCWPWLLWRLLHWMFTPRQRVYWNLRSLSTSPFLARILSVTSLSQLITGFYVRWRVFSFHLHVYWWRRILCDSILYLIGHSAGYFTGTIHSRFFLINFDGYSRCIHPQRFLYLCYRIRLLWKCSAWIRHRSWTPCFNDAQHLAQSKCRPIPRAILV